MSLGIRTYNPEGKKTFDSVLVGSTYKLLDTELLHFKKGETAPPRQPVKKILLLPAYQNFDRFFVNIIPYGRLFRNIKDPSSLVLTHEFINSGKEIEFSLSIGGFSEAHITLSEDVYAGIFYYEW
ncbi:hypothetical protein [Endozoicomonas sp. Mp262]|uniref:hypothetical protein n=1 Tax=Endozoicomonas sp. Mp262 TaxID=2919499 RepID=UPI0021DA5253